MLRQGAALLGAILVGAIIGPYWIGGKHCSSECIMTRQAVSISRSPNYQFVDEPGSVQVSRLNPILVGDFTQEKSFHGPHLSIEERIVGLDFARFWRNGDGLFGSQRPTNRSWIIPFEQFEGVAHFGAQAHRLALNSNLQVPCRGIAVVGEFEFCFDDTAFLSRKNENATFFILGPLIHDLEIDFFEMNKCTLANKQRSIQHSIRFFERFPLQPCDYSNCDDCYRSNDAIVDVKLVSYPTNVLPASSGYGIDPFKHPGLFWLGIAVALVGGLLALAGFGGESLLAFFIGGVLFVAGCHLASTNSRAENVVVEAVVIAKLEFSDVQRHFLPTL
jgi:hypothetical protein